MEEEIKTVENEEKILQKVKSKRRIRGLLIAINVILMGYFIFEVVNHTYTFFTEINSDAEIISLNNKNRSESLKIYDQYLEKNNSQYVVKEAYDYGIYGGYLHLSHDKMENNSYHSFKTTSLINVSSSSQTKINIKTNSNYLNGGIDLFSLNEGDYLVFDEYLTSENFSSKHQAIKIRSEKGINETIYSLPKENGERKKVTIKSKDSSPSLVISVSKVNSLENNYYDYVFIGEEDNVNEYLQKNNIASYNKIFKTKSLIEAFTVNSSYAFILTSEQEIYLPSNYQITENEKITTSKDKSFVENDYLYSQYVTELGGYLTSSGSCQKDQEVTFLTKPYLKGYDIGKLVIGIPKEIKLNEIILLL